MGLIEDKAALRREMMAARDRLLPTERKLSSLGIATVGVPAELLKKPSNVSSYYAIGAELDMTPLERILIEAGHSICLPCIQGKAEPMLFRTRIPGAPMRERKWGIMEPIEPAPSVDPDVLLVPLLAWDAQGYRLGYGGGYYDRTIEALRRRKPVVVVGVAYDEQKVDVVPRLDYDQRLDWMLTPSGVIRFT